MMNLQSGTFINLFYILVGEPGVVLGDKDVGEGVRDPGSTAGGTTRAGPA